MTATLLCALGLMSFCWQCLGLLESHSFASPTTSDLETFRTFEPEQTSDFKTLLVSNDGQTLFVGAREKVFGLNLGDISRPVFRSLSWASNRSHSCNRRNPDCGNLIQVIHQLNATRVLICGTNFMAPKNKLLVRTDSDSESEYVLQDENMLDLPLCSYYPNDSVTSLAVPSTNGGTAFFSTTRSHIDSEMSLVKQTFDRHTVLANEQKISSYPRYVASFFAHDSLTFPSVRMEKVYAVSVETAREVAVPAPIQRATVTQVCANDLGGSEAFHMRWTSLLKLRLHCSTDTENHQSHFNLVTDMVRGSGDLVYGTFMTLDVEPQSSAVCSFRLTDIQAAFDSNQLQTAMGDKYSAINYNSLRLAMCPHEAITPRNKTSRDIPDYFLLYISKIHLMVKEVAPAYPSWNKSRRTLTHGPLFVRGGEKFSKIAVQQVTDAVGETHDVLFVATNTGLIHKVVSVRINNEIETLELATYRPSAAAILSMTLSQSKDFLYVGTRNAVYQLSTANCESYAKSCEHCDRCRMCVLSRDPFCGWDTSTEQCVSIRNGHRNTTKQDIYHGNADTICDSISKTVSNPTRAFKGRDATLGHIVRNPSVTAKWWKLHDGTKELIPEPSDKYGRSTYGQIKILNFEPGIDSAFYECEYSVGNITVALWSHQLSEETPRVDRRAEFPPRAVRTPKSNSSVKDDSEIEAIAGTTTAVLVFLLLLALAAFKFRREKCSKLTARTNQIQPSFLPCVTAPVSTQYFDIRRAYTSLPPVNRGSAKQMDRLSSTLRGRQIDIVCSGDQFEVRPREHMLYLTSDDLRGERSARISV